MDLRQLRYFASVARERSFSRASVKLGIAQPALSRHIATLEHEIGVELFVRTPKGVDLTESGSRLMEKADFVLRYVSEIKNGINQLATQPSGEIILGLSPSFASLVAPRLLIEVKRRYPLVVLRIVEGLSMVLYEMLEEAKADLALVTDFGSVAGLDRLEIAHDEIVFIGTPEKLAPYEHAETIELRDIVRFPLVMTQGFHQLIGARLREEALELTSEMEISSTPIVTDIVRRGDHCSVVGYSFVHEEVMQGRLRAIRLAGAPIRRRILVTWPTNHPQSLALRAVKGLVIDEVARLGVTMMPEWRASAGAGNDPAVMQPADLLAR